MVAIGRAARRQRHERIRQQLCAIVGLAAGAGLDPSDLRPLRARDIVDLGIEGIDVHVPAHGNRAARVVPVRRTYEALVREGIAGYRPSDLVIGKQVDRRNVTTGIIDAAELFDVEHLDASRLRSTWLAWIVTQPISLRAVMDAAGLKTARSITEIIADLRNGAEQAAGDEFRGDGQMIKPRDLHAALHIIDTSDAVEVLVSGYRTSTRGRPANRNGLRLMLLGLYLSIWQHGTGTLTGAITALSTLTIEEQQRIGYATLDRTRRRPHRLQPTVTLTDFYNIERAVVRGLSYSSNSNPDLADHELERRHNAVQQFCDAVMDASIIERSSTAIAMDATGIWSWGIGPKKTGEALAAETGLAIGNPVSDDTVDEADDDPTDAAETAAPVMPDGEADDTVDERAGRRMDLDAGWGVKTAKNGKSEVFFGYHEHTLVQVPQRDATTTTRSRNSSDASS
jgi:hypothetical protein